MLRSKSTELIRPIEESILKILIKTPQATSAQKRVTLRTIIHKLPILMFHLTLVSPDRALLRLVNQVMHNIKIKTKEFNM